MCCMPFRRRPAHSAARHRSGNRAAARTEAVAMMARRVFKSVWDALEDSPEQAANMRLRSELMIALRAQVESWGITQARAAKRLRIAQPRLNDLLRGRIDKFSLDALVSLAEHAGLDVRLRVKTAA